MIIVSNAVAEMLNQDSRQFRLDILQDGQSVDIDVLSATINKGACGDFMPGTVFIPSIDLKAVGAPDIRGEFQVKMSILLESGEFSESYSLGFFTPSPNGVSKTKDQTQIIAYGRLYGANSDVLYTTEPAEKTLYGVLQDIRDKGYTVLLKMN